MGVITAMNKLDLNLLQVFDAVMTEGHVTRAAARLAMTQPAVSNALKRLRHVLKDELFVKVPGGVRPTPKAAQLWPPVRDALGQLRATLAPADFDPGTARASFALSMTDLIAHLITPRLYPAIAAEAPRVDLRTAPYFVGLSPQSLEKGDIDLAIGAFSEIGPRLKTRRLWTDRYMCVMRKHHPLAAAPLTLERFCAADHLLVSLSGDALGIVDGLLAERGLERRVALTVNQFAVAAKVLPECDLVATLPLRFAEEMNLQDRLAVREPPLDIRPLHINLLWHERDDRNPAHQWLRTTLVRLCGEDRAGSHG